MNLLLWFFLASFCHMWRLPPTPWLLLQKKEILQHKVVSPTVSTALIVQEIINWLESGISAQNIFHKISPPEELSSCFEHIQYGISAGLPVHQAIAESFPHTPEQYQQFLKELAQCWAVSLHSGSSLTTVLKHLADHLESREDNTRAIARAIAGPQATIQVLTALPFLGLGMSYLMGMFTLETVWKNPISIMSIIIGIGLNALSYICTKYMIRQVK